MKTLGNGEIVIHTQQPGSGYSHQWNAAEAAAVRFRPGDSFKVIGGKFLRLGYEIVSASDLSAEHVTITVRGRC